MGPQLADLAASGDVRFEVHYYPIFQATGRAIVAVECAGDQGYWWAMHDRILEDQIEGIRAQKTVEELDGLLNRYAADLGLDTAAFAQCLASDEKADELLPRVIEQYEAGQDLGITGTPTFVLNGKPLPIKAWDDVTEAVREELNRQ